VVNAPAEQAFTAFTGRFGDFKPPEHNLLAAAIAETVFEPRVGGHIYDRAVDGSECRWARILAYEPPARVVFSWDISPQWQLETDPELTSEVEVRFVAEGPDRHGIGKLLVPLIVRRQAQKEMPANVEALKRRVEAQQPQHPA
jgi:uncharacterized protein YndB with AHSA1/START domain